MEVVPATIDHAYDFLTRPIRQLDVDEWVLIGGRPVSISLMQCIHSQPDTARALVAGDRCIALWGVIKEDYWPSLGGVWLIASQEAEDRANAIHRLWRKEIEIMHSHRPVLRAAVMERNELHRKWLYAVGFVRGGAMDNLPGFALWERVDPSWKQEGLAPCVVH